MKLLIKIFATIFAFVVLLKATRSVTHAFTEDNIYKIEGKSQDTGFTHPNETGIFDQPFHYIGCGTQCFALCSEDKTTVIKLLRKDRTTHPLKWCSSYIPAQLRRRLEKTLQKRKRCLSKMLKSYSIAYENLREQTGLINIQLTPGCDSAPLLTYTDAIGVLHHLKLSSTPFLIQKYAEPFYPTLLHWITNGEILRAKQALTELIALLETRCKRGIADKNPSLKTNFGWIQDHPVQIDVGRFTHDLKRSLPENYSMELVRLTDRLCQWLDIYCPELADWMRRDVRNR